LSCRKAHQNAVAQRALTAYIGLCVKIIYETTIKQRFYHNSTSTIRYAMFSVSAQFAIKNATY